MDACCDKRVDREDFRNKDFNPVECVSICKFDTLTSQIAMQLKLVAERAKLIPVFGIGRMCHIAFCEPRFTEDYAIVEECNL